jgi:succinate dehydrogenase/fumarate reductase flavoprotein subunit
MESKLSWRAVFARRKEMVIMSTWHEFIQRDAPIPEWPYPVRYGVENEINTDVLIIGGGIAGSHAAIAAAKRGVKVLVVEKAATKRSGRGGMGVDHWHAACTNPCSRVTPEEYTQKVIEFADGYTCGPSRYIDAKESWDVLLDCEGIGVKIRDVEDDFKGADFRDEETKLLFAYDYENRHSMRVFGWNMKQCLHKEMKRLGVEIFDRVMVTSLLSEEGEQGAPVVGATGINVRTGEFYIFKAKATVVSTGITGRLWMWAPEVSGSRAMTEINDCGDGFAIGWNAGAEFNLMEQVRPSMGYDAYIQYGMGGASNTWHGTSIVDAKGREVPWVNRDGEKLKTVRERFLPASSQEFMLGVGIGLFGNRMDYLNQLAPDLPQRIAKGEFTLPLYADLTCLPELERKAIFGLMVGNEGKTRIPVYDVYTKAGFDSERDMLQAPIMEPQAYGNSNFWGGRTVPYIQAVAGGGYMVDWDLGTSLSGLYAAGNCIFGSGDHSSAAVSGRYAGRKAASYVKSISQSAVSRNQIDTEKKRVYAPLKQDKGGMGWKELNTGITRIMQDYCGQFKNEETLSLGLSLLKDLRETEASKAYASTPHELGRLLECFSIMTCGEIVMNASRARKATNETLAFRRLDYPQADPRDWQKFIPVRLENDEVKTREVPLDYYLKPPYASTLEENYRRHCGL